MASDISCIVPFATPGIRCSTARARAASTALTSPQEHSHGAGDSAEESMAQEPQPMKKIVQYIAYIAVIYLRFKGA